LEAKFEELQAGLLHKGRNSVNKSDPSSSSTKDKERPLEEKAGQQREDPISPPYVKTGGTNTFERPRVTLFDIAQDLMEHNYYDRHDHRNDAGDITKKVCVGSTRFCWKN
jgi:hypothetical protein